MVSLQGATVCLNETKNRTDHERGWPQSLGPALAISTLALASYFLKFSRNSPASLRAVAS